MKTENTNRIIALKRYLELIVKPTYEEFRRHPHSLRHAYLACTTTFHAIDRINYPKSSGNLRKKWRDASLDFCIVDHVAHDFKHVRSDMDAGVAKGVLTLRHAIYGGRNFGTDPLNGTGELDALRHLVFVVRDAIKFIEKQAEKEPE